MLFVFLCLLLLITFLSLCLEMGSRRMYSMTFSDIEIDLTSSSPDPPSLFVKRGLILCWSFSNYQGLSLATTIFHWGQTANLQSCLHPQHLQVHPISFSLTFCSPAIGCPLYQYAQRSGGGFCLCRMRQQARWVLQHFPCHEVWEPQQLFIWCGVATQQTHQFLHGISVLLSLEMKIIMEMFF